MMMRRRALLAAVALFAGWAGAAHVTGGVAVAAAGNPAAEAAIATTIDGAFAVLKDRALAGKAQRPRRIAALRAIADKVFDWAEMARGSLGVAWRSLDPARRTRFVDVFKSILAAQYMDDIDRFQGSEVVKVTGSTPQGEEVLVRSTLITASRDRVPIDYLMRSEQGQWRVIDISIEGVSLVNHFRKTFSAALVNMTVEQLIERLRRQLPAE
jgi:phospholipid transport system substrate-binding protein